MRAKKLISIALLAALGISAQAQIVSSRSDQVIVTQQIKEKKPKKPRTFKWNLRLGYSFDSMTGGDDLSGASGFDASFGISKPFGNNGMFWGVEAGAMSYGACMDDYDPTRCIGICATPRIGIKFPIGKEASFNLYGGPYIGYRFGEKDYNSLYYSDVDYTDSEGHYQYRYEYNDQVLEIEDDIDAGINIGVELFVSKNFFFDIHIKKGLTSSGKSGYRGVSYDSGSYYGGYNYSDDYKDISSLKIVLGCGFQF